MGAAGVVCLLSVGTATYFSVERGQGCSVTFLTSRKEQRQKGGERRGEPESALMWGRRLAAQLGLGGPKNIQEVGRGLLGWWWGFRPGSLHPTSQLQGVELRPASEMVPSDLLSLKVGKLRPREETYFAKAPPEQAGVQATVESPP